MLYGQIFQLIGLFGIIVMQVTQSTLGKSCNKKCYKVKNCNTQVLLCNNTISQEMKILNEISCLEEKNVLKIGADNPEPVDYIHPETWNNMLDTSVLAVFLGTPVKNLTRNSISTIPKSVSNIILDGFSLANIEQFIFEEKKLVPVFFLNPNMSSLSPANYSKLQAKKQSYCRRILRNKCFCVDETQLTGSSLNKFRYLYQMKRVFNCRRRPACKDCSIDMTYEEFAGKVEKLRLSPQRPNNYCSKGSKFYNAKDKMIIITVLFVYMLY